MSLRSLKASVRLCSPPLPAAPANPTLKSFNSLQVQRQTVENGGFHAGSVTLPPLLYAATTGAIIGASAAGQCRASCVPPCLSASGYSSSRFSRRTRHWGRRSTTGDLRCAFSALGTSRAAQRVDGVACHRRQVSHLLSSCYPLNLTAPAPQLSPVEGVLGSRS